FLTVLGNIVAVTSIIAVVSLIQGLNEYVTDAVISGVGADAFTIQRMPIVRTQEDEERIRNNPQIKVTEGTAVRRYSENITAVAAQANAGYRRSTRTRRSTRCRSRASRGTTSSSRRSTRSAADASAPTRSNGTCR